MDNKIQLQIINSLLELNNDRITIYTLVKNEIVYPDLKIILADCIQKSLLFKEELLAEKKRIVSKVNYKTPPNQDFFNVWLEINECLSVHKRKKIRTLFTASENIFEKTYNNVLKEGILKHLTPRHKNLLLKQKELLSAS